MKFSKVMAGGALVLSTSPVFAAGPTLGDIFKNSGVDINGYIDTSAIYNTQGPFNSLRVYDQQGRSFNLQMLELAVSKLPDEGFGGAVVLNAGPDASVDQSVTESDQSGANDPANGSFVTSGGLFGAGFDVQQAYLSYKHKDAQVVFGKLPTLIGFEVIESPLNYNFSRSYLFGWGPFIQTGARVYYQVSPTLKAVVGVNNGWDVLPTDLTPKTVEAQLAWSPTDDFFISIEGDSGIQGSGTGSPAGLRQIIDLVSTYNVNKALTLGVNAAFARQENALRPDGKGGSLTDAAHWNGQALYANYQATDHWRVALRAQRFDDGSGYRGSQVGFWSNNSASYYVPAAQKLYSQTLTVAYAPVDSVELRGEYRHDTSTQAVFVKSDGTQGHAQNTISFEGIYKF